MVTDYQNDGAERTSTVPSEKNIDDIILAYIIFGQDSSNGWTGAVMLTDSRTRPLHFGFATPIRPGTLQRLLYGGTLDEYIKVDVIANKLVNELPRVPDVIFVESPELVAVRRIVQFPVAALSRSHEVDGNANLSVVQFSTGENSSDHDQVAHW
jgi:hypothetical protein